ncbi:glycosyltransferase 87 family protein [Kocuria palustris]|uniref:glycosyltransferase 87 family protein n=1 Tax=Kocuria palustris TaxID=71999 RepID=UPI001642E87A|nr:glycosyltransferase 87 family protein [Kocuria palustris]
MSSTLWRDVSTAASARQAPRWAMRAGVAVIGVLFAAYMSAIYWGTPGLDMEVYWRAAQVLHGLNPATDELYAPSLVETRRFELPFTYPPSAALLFFPLGGLSLEQAWHLMCLGGSLLMVVLVWLVLRLAPFSRSWFGVRVVPTLVAFSLGCLAASHLYPVRYTFFYGQINTLLAVLILFDLGRESTRRRAAGFLTGLAAGLKITPAAMGLVPLALQQWRTIAGMAAGFAATVVFAALFLPRQVFSYFTDQLWSTDRVGDATRLSNQSLTGTLHQWGFPDGSVRPLWLVLSLLLIVAGALAIRRLARHDDLFSAVCIGAMVMLLISPISWEHHWVWVLPLAAALIPHAPAQRTSVGWSISLALFASLWFLFANNPALIAAHMLGDLNADYYFYPDSRLQAVVATLPVLAAIAAAAWISLRPQREVQEPMAQGPSSRTDR